MAYHIPIRPMLWRAVSIVFICLAIINTVLPTPITFSSFDFSLQITLPMTTELPTFLLGRKYKTGYHGQSYGQSYYRQRRSLKDGSADDNEMLPNNLDGIFSHLGLHQAPCQRKLICLIAQDPEKYSPLTQVIFRQLNSMQKELSGSDMNQTSSLWYYMDFYDADNDMYSLTNCTQSAASCHKHPDENIDWNTIKAWQSIMNFVKIELK